MRKHRLGLFLMLLVLAAAPGCRTLATAGVIDGAVAIDIAASYYEEDPPCDHHSAAPPTGRCR